MTTINLENYLPEGVELIPHDVVLEAMQQVCVKVKEACMKEAREAEVSYECEAINNNVIIK